MPAPDETRAETVAPDLARVRQRIRAAVLLSGAVIATLAVVGGIGRWLTAGSGLATATLVWVAVAAICGWLGVATARRPVSTLFAVMVVVSSVNAAVSQLAAGATPAIVPTFMVVTLWLGLLVRPRWHILVALYALCAPLLAGAELAIIRPAVHDPKMVELTMLLVALVVPLAFNFLVTMGNQSVERRLQSALSQVEQDRKAKAEALAASQQQLVNAQKLEMIGTMAAGLAHELNNILTPIRGFAERLIDGVGDEEARRYGRKMLDSTAAAASITDALLTYTRQGTFDPVQTEVGRLLEREILPVLSKSLPTDVALRVDFERNVYVAVDRVLLQQCVANLVHNAAAAMPGGGEVRISLTTRDWEPDPSMTPDPEGLEPVGGRSCVLAVSDTGTGIDPEHMDRIFDPFFTTKGVGAGSGLGLAIVQGIVAMHGGYVRVESSPGKGSTFTLVLPAVAREGSSLEISPEPVPAAHRGKVAVVVTPDQDLLDELEELVASLGYTPSCTKDAARADELLAASAPDVGLVVVDLDHPAATTGRLSMRVRERLPATPIVLLASPESKTGAVDMLSKPRGLLRKPVDPALFARLVTTLVSPEKRAPSLPRIEAVR